ncbi:MAG: DUF4159 domain-containing protein [Rhodobacteraceae bacterium]|nr:DUF4159 domain-containing protein [Paracoccaceae bacterium]
MFAIGPIAFTAPALLLGLLALPVLWFLLRAVPPAPIRRRFPGVVLLLGLEDEENEADKTPWWLLLLRMLAIAALIIAFAGPVLNADDEVASSDPLLVVMDGTWADARDWSRRVDRVDGLLAEAGRAGRTASVVVLTDLPPDGVTFQAAAQTRQRLAALEPEPFGPTQDDVNAWAGTLDGSFETAWVSDGVAWPWRDDLLSALEARGAVRVFETGQPIIGLRPAVFEDGVIRVSAFRLAAGLPYDMTVNAHGLDPAGIPRTLSTARMVFAPSETTSEVEIALPPELRNRVTRFEIAGLRSAAAVSLTDDALRRREVALISATDDREGLALLTPTHYLEQALTESADLIDGTLSDVLLANPDVIVLADVASVESEADALLEWVQNGGLLVRFAGPRLAASDISRTEQDPLLPVRLRAGGRSVGGAMSWGEPKALRPFGADSPFFGLTVPEEVTVTAQVMAQPDPTLSERTIASLSDGTPLVTRKREGAGQIVLFHVTANAEWASLPLSVLYVQMLDRLAISSRSALPSVEDLTGTVWLPDEVLDAFGTVEDAGLQTGVPGETLAEAAVGPELRPGLYAGEERRIAINVVGPETAFLAAQWPANVPVEGMQGVEEQSLKSWFLNAAIIALLIDVVASLWLGGRLSGFARRAAVGLLAATFVAAPEVQAQTQERFAVAATNEVLLAHVITGDAQVDRVADAGLRGLSEVLFRRTSIEPAEPVAVDLEMDELSFFPFLYWPVTEDQPLPSSEAYAKLNRYLRSGGMILFDTRDANVAGLGTTSVLGRKLQQLARPLDIPPLEPVPSDHVLTRTFYLLQDFPGRHAGADVWVEAAPADAELADGMPFRNLNDNVTPVVIGGNDWASAWATDAQGNRMFPVGRGFAGERQRELSYRFGVNLIMHVLTGNYKSDQVHVPALLDRLGQ